VHCQILDAAHPGVVNMSKVNFDAKNEYDMVNNYKQLQSVFDKLKIARNIEVSKLVKGRPLDNLEFLQWIKYYYDTVTGGPPPEGYDGDERRQVSKGAGAIKKPGSSNGRTAPGVSKTASVKTSKPVTTARAASSNASKPSSATSAEMKLLSAENAELKLTVERTEQEREFYFEKLQDIEFLCQRTEFSNKHLAKVVEKILYFTEGKPDVDAIIKECAEGGETVAETAVETATEIVAPEPIEELDPEATTPTFSEATALGASLEKDSFLAETETNDVSMTVASPLCAALEETRAPLSPQQVNI